MAWTAQLTGAVTDRQTANVTATLQFSESVTGEVQTRAVPSNNWTAESLAIFAQGIITTLEARDAALASMQANIKSGPYAIQLPRDGFPTPNADADKTARAQAAKIAGLSQQIAQLNTLQSAASAGIIPADDPDLTAAQSAVQALAPAKGTTTATPGP